MPEIKESALELIGKTPVLNLTDIVKRLVLKM